MKRLFLIVMVLLLLSGIGVVIWTAAGLPPVRMVWSYGFSYQPEPTGTVVPYKGVEFVEIGPGCFRMGSNQGARGGDFLGRWCARLGLPWGIQPKPSNEMPVHWAEFPRGFWIARTEVTNLQYEMFNPMHERSGDSRWDNDPVANVSWEDAKEYCAWLSGKSGLLIRLPSESEWECACRAGSEGEFCSGDEEKGLGEFAWMRANSDGIAHTVGTRRENAWGLHDLHGNLWEWCEDAYHDSYNGARVDGTAWTEDGELWRGKPRRVIRGGGWRDWAVRSRSAYRTPYTPDFRGGEIGFRPAFVPSGP